MPDRSGADDLSRVFHPLADPSRQAIVQRLARGPAAVKTVAEPLTMSLQAVMEHLKVLADAGVISTGRPLTYEEPLTNWTPWRPSSPRRPDH